MRAAERDLVDVVRLLLDLGAPLEVENDQKQRPLHAAAGGNAVRVATLLIERGAQIDPVETQWDATPLGMAMYGNHAEMIRLLVPLTRNVLAPRTAGRGRSASRGAQRGAGPRGSA